MADLLVTSHTPTLGVGRALRTYAIARALAEHGPVDLLYVVFGADEPAREYVEHPGIRLHPVQPSRGLGRALAYAGARARRVPDAIARGVSGELAARAAALADAPGRGRVIADGMTVAAALAPVARRRPVIFNGHNLETGLQPQLGQLSMGSPVQVQRFERGILQRSAEAWMVSRADVEGARALAPGTTVRYVPNVVDVAAVPPRAAVDRDAVILLVADFTWPPNQGAVRFLLDEVMPTVWARRPDARLALVGRGLDLTGRDVDGRVDALGFVDDLDAAYAAAACAAVPLLTGGGSPLKFVEALAHGLPVVATPLAAQGLDDLVAGEHYVEADGGAAFADALVGVLDGAGDGDAIAAAGRAVAGRAYSVQTLSELLAPGAPLRL